MITALAQQIQTQISYRNTLEQRRDNRKSIADTYQKLAEVEKILRQAIVSFNLIRSRLTNEQVEEAIKQLQTIISKLKASQEKFTDEYRQIRDLNSLENLVNTLNDFLGRAWASYALEQTQTPFELLKLVETLPEVRGQIAIIRTIQEDLYVASSTLPRRESSLDKFDKDLQSLREYLANLRGLAPEVIAFLRKVQRGTASVADLTDEFLQWCQENERATAFKISFGQTR